MQVAMETKNAHRSYSQFWQNLPMNPGGQLHDPLCLSHTPPFSQTGQVSVQPGPQKPSGHTVKKVDIYIFIVVIVSNVCGYFVVSFLKRNLSALTVLTVLSWRPRWTLALSRHFVTQGAGAVTRMHAAWSKPSLWTVWHGTHARHLSQHGRTKTEDKRNLTACGERALCWTTYPDRSSLHDVQESIFVGTLHSHDHMTLPVDRRTSSHSRLHKYLGCILEAEQDRAFTYNAVLNCNTRGWKSAFLPFNKWLNDFVSVFIWSSTGLYCKFVKIWSPFGHWR